MILKGQDALNKTNQLMESMMVDKKTNTFGVVESTHVGYDGKTYGIIKENSNYVLKVSEKENPIIAEDFEYINGVQNKQKNVRNSYSESVKHFNLMNIDFKRIYGDSLVEETKTVLKVKKKTSEPIDSSSDFSAESNEFNDNSNDGFDLDSNDELKSNDNNEQSFDGDSNNDNSENPDDYADVNPDDLDGEDPKKKIQQLSGKLAYELREFDDEEEYSDVAKFAISMTTSALDTTKMSDGDKQSIENKVSKKMSGESSDETSNNGFDNENSDDLDLNSNDDNGQSEEESNDNNQNMGESIKISKGKLMEFFQGKSDAKDILFDVNKNKSGEMILFDEEPYYPKNQMPNSKAMQTKIGDVTIGRYDGDDKSYEKQLKSKDIPRNPFKYR